MDADPFSTSLFLQVAAETHEVSTFKIFATIFLVFLNGFFVAAEFAIVKVRASQLEVLPNVNKSLAAIAKKIVGQLDAYLAATQLGITLASLGLGWVGESVMEGLILAAAGDWISESTAKAISLPLGFTIITVLHIVFGELAPKSLAIRFPTKTTLYVSWPLRIFYFIFRPVIWSMNGFANGLLRLIGIKPIHGSEIHTEEELKMIISESHEGGAIEETERELIQNVFDFDDRRVLNIYTMRKNLSAISIDATVREALDYAIKEGYSRYPVYEEDLDNIKGLLYTKDLMRSLMMNKAEEEGIKPLLRKAYYISENAKIKNVLKDFQRKHIQMALVTNEIGEFSGIVTMEDILEELVGEIQDEYDNEKPIVEKTAEDTYIISAHSNLTDINKYLPVKLEEGEHYDTLSGLIADKLDGKELQEGEKISLGKYDGLIMKMYRNSVETVELWLENSNSDENEE